MFFSESEVFEFINENDVKFIRLAFCDVFGMQKNISILPGELLRAFSTGISIDASAIRGFGSEEKSDLFLFPDPTTFSLLPWRPSNGRVVRLFCNIKYPDGTDFELDSRLILKQAVKCAQQAGYGCEFGVECEFYLFKLDESGNPTDIPFDNAGYLDIAPEDKGENVRREICLTLEEMGIIPETSHHEDGPGQNEICFKHSTALICADNATTFKSVVKTIAARNGLYATFEPKPIKACAGNGFHINMSPHKIGHSPELEDHQYFIAGILKYISEMTVFLNRTEDSYLRFGDFRAPKYITWSPQNRSQLIRIPSVSADEMIRLEVRSPDPMTNPYLAFALLLNAGIEGINNKIPLTEPINISLFNAGNEQLEGLELLPSNYKEAINLASSSEFIKNLFPTRLIEAYLN